MSSASVAYEVALWFAAAISQSPVIDMHMHVSHGRPLHPEFVCTGDELKTYPTANDAVSQNERELPCAHPLRSAANGDDMLRQTLDEFRRHHVKRAILAAGKFEADDWRNAPPGVFIAGLDFTKEPRIAPEELRKMFAEGRFAVFAEVHAQPRGIRADDPQLAPYWALAEELDIPIGIHLDDGEPNPQRPMNTRVVW